MGNHPFLANNIRGKYTEPKNASINNRNAEIKLKMSAKSHRKTDVVCPMIGPYPHNVILKNSNLAHTFFYNGNCTKYHTMYLTKFSIY